MGATRATGTEAVYTTAGVQQTGDAHIVRPSKRSSDNRDNRGSVIGVHQCDELHLPVSDTAQNGSISQGLPASPGPN